MGEKQSLRAISEELIHIMDQAEQAAINDEGSDTQSYDLVAKMDELMDKLNGKVDGVLDYIMKLQGDVEGVAVKIAHLMEAKRLKEARIEKLQKYLKLVMVRQGLVEMDTGEHILKLRKNPPKVDITNEHEIPKVFYKYTVETKKSIATYEDYIEMQERPGEDGITYKFKDTLDKAMIKQAIKEGQEVPGAMLVQESKLVVA